MLETQQFGGEKWRKLSMTRIAAVSVSWESIVQPDLLSLFVLLKLETFLLFLICQEIKKKISPTENRL